MSTPPWSALLTEQRNPASEYLDEMSTLEMLALINQEDARVAAAVARELPAIARAVELVVAVFRRGGRLFYLGAGTSGRLGILDASECPPTFNADPEMVQGLIAGGEEAVFRAVEGAEDQRERASSDLLARGFGAGDALFGIAASGVTPFVLGGLDYARQVGAATVFFTCSPNAAAAVEAEVKITPEVGPEVLTGSTRMKAGTATKLVLNMVTTAAMVRLGKTYGNLMVDLQPKNAKLRDRSQRILSSLAQVPPAEAQRLLATAGQLKVAIIMALCHLDAEGARAALAAQQGSVRATINQHRAAEAR